MTLPRSIPGLLSLMLILLLGAVRASADDSSLTLADLEGYRQALSIKPDDSAPLVKFRDLWDRPEAYTGRVVKVEGRVARLFQQGRLGEFPPLVEAWVVSPSGDPFCLVFPSVDGQSPPEIGASVKFFGTFLKRIKYQGGDTARVAPLLVGPQAPTSSSTGSKTDGQSWSSTDWMLAVGAMMVFMMILARRHFDRPVEHSLTIDPPPAFIDGEQEEEEGHDENTR
jgi:hypothetical protein